MAQRSKFVQWSPHHEDMFAQYYQDLRLYKCEELRTGGEDAGDPAAGEGGKSARNFKVVAQKTDILGVRCMSWCPDANEPLTLAVGLRSGTVVLTSFGPQLNKEFQPRANRGCNALAWNPLHTNHLAVGMDKVRTDYGVAIWDVHRTGVSGMAPSEHSATSVATSSPLAQYMSATSRRASTSVHSHMRPFRDLSYGEAAVAVNWLPNSAHCLAVGGGMKWLRIYDLRGDVQQPQSVAAGSKGIYGVKFDPFDATRVATTSEDGIVRIWDVRKLTAAVHHITTGFSVVSEMEWCPTRRLMIACSSLESPEVRVFTVQESGSHESDEMVLRSNIWRSLSRNESVAAFAWHPTSEQRLLTLTDTSLRLQDEAVADPIPVAWSAQGELCFSASKQLCIADVEDMDGPLDIASEMQARAKAGYGMNVSANKQFIDKHRDAEHGLQLLWTWMHHLQETHEGPTTSDGVSIFDGISRIFNGTQKVKERAPEKNPIEGDEMLRKAFPVYTSPARQGALELCGWGFNAQTLETTLKNMEAAGKYENAAALALFHLDLRRAIQSLKQDKDLAKERDLQLVAMAMSGFTESTKSLWKEMCMSLRDRFNHPYLRVAFAMLSSETREYREVLQVPHIELSDKIGFACRFLPDKELHAWLKRTHEHYVREGLLEGILLTGLTSDGVALLEQYVNRTGDVQTAALAMSHVVPRIFKDVRVERWLQEYRGLLDVWQLWHQRAFLDCDLVRETDKKPPSQVFVRCNFCSQPLTHGVPMRSGPGARRPQRFGMRSSAPKPKTSSPSTCPRCGKALPRCALCLQSLGTPDMQKNTRSKTRFDKAKEQGGKPSVWTASGSDFGHWFVWCQSCRHGGHQKHMDEWFSTHTECPVSNCKCKCKLL